MDGSTRFHRFRYHVGRGFVSAGDRVLDVGSGKGYGGEMMSDIASAVLGIELEQDEVDFANKNRGKFNLSFIQGNLEEMILPECDVATAFEIIEHLYEPKQFIDKLKSVTKKYIIFSVPLGQKLVEGKQEVEQDSTHHSVFSEAETIMEMFVDDDWKEFVRYQQGAAFIGVVYNNNFI